MEFKQNNVNIFITGASGLIGSNIVSLLLSESKVSTVIAVVHNYEKAERIFGNNCNNSKLKILVQDICQPIKYDGPVDYFIHAAGVTGGSKQHIVEPMKTINTAILGTLHALDFAKEKGVKGFVYLSSLEVYGKIDFSKKFIYENDGGYIDTMNVRSSYSESKRMCECICTSYFKQYGLRTIVARLAATFGPGTSYSDGRVFAEFARDVIEQKDIVLKSTGETVRNYCDVEDCARALILLLEKGSAGEAYNIANVSTTISIKKLAERFIELFPESGISLKFDTSVDATKMGYNPIQRTVLDSEKIQALGWKPVYSLDETIIRLVESMKIRKGEYLE